MVIKKCLKYFFFAVLINPVFTAAFFLAVLFYTDTLKLSDRKQFSCLFFSSEVTAVEGTVWSSPVKTSEGTYYTALFETKKAYKQKFQSGGSKGLITVLFPATMIEALYPGKLYTGIKSNNHQHFLIESGYNFHLEVSCTDIENNLFIVNKVRPVSHSGLLFKLTKIRALSRLTFKRLMFGWGKSGGLLLALLSGSKEYTDKTLSDGFKDAGLSHILALSGMHLNLFGGLAFFFGTKITRRNLADLIQLSAVVFFVWFAGASPSLFRAMLSALIVYINSLLRMNRFKGLTVLSLTFIIHLLIYPHHLKTPAFMLSYGALAGIMSIGQIIKFSMGRLFLPEISSRLSESLGAQIFTAPLTLKIFGKFMPAGVAATLFAGPLTNIFLYTGLSGTILCLIMPFLSGAFNVIMNCIYNIILKCVLLFSKIPAVTV